jgi:hypothetical protein
VNFGRAEGVALIELTPIRCRVFSIMFASLVGRFEAPQLLEPVLDEDHLGQGLGFSFFEFHHQESLSVGRNVPAAYRMATRVSRLLKQEAWLAGGKTGPCLNIN